MVIDDKYLELIHTQIYDKRTKMCGMISDLFITKCFGGYTIGYTAFANRLHSRMYIFIEDFEKGNVVFLMPYDYKNEYYEKELKKIAERHRKAIKDFFGDKFREDMIMEISEDELQNERREWEKRLRSIENWADKLKDCCCEL